MGNESHLDGKGNKGRLWLWPAGLMALVLLLAAIGLAMTLGNRQSQPVNVADLLTKIGFDSRLNESVPMDTVLRDESGNEVTLADLGAGKPVILALVYYRCPMLCNMTLDGLVRGLSRTPLDAGREFTVVAVSFDPSETAQLAREARDTALARYGRAGADRGWRFATGTEEQVRRLAQSVGFRYQYDESTKQYAHAAGVVVLTGEGTISRYLYGVEFSPRDLRLSLADASGGEVGSATERVLLLCFHYDPSTGKYGLAVMRLVKLGGLLTVLGLAGSITLALRRERRLAKRLPASARAEYRTSTAEP